MSATSRAPARALTDVLFEDSTLARCLIAPDGAVVRVNAEWLASTGCAVGQAADERILELLPATRHTAVAMLARARTGHRVEVPRHARVVDGRETWWEGSIDPVELEGGTGLLITTRRLTQGRASRDEELLQRLFDRLPVMITLYDPALGSFRFNAHFKRTLGWTEEDAAEGDLMALAYPDPAVRADASRFMGSLASGWREFPVTAKDGTVVQTSWANLRLSDDTLVGIGLDLREQKRSEERLHDEERKYRNLFQHSLDAVYLTRADGAILDANPAACRLHDMSVEEIRQAGRAGLVVQDDRHAAGVHERARTGRMWGEMTVRRKDGTTVPVEVQSVLLDQARPGRSEAFVITRNITERKRAEEALRAELARYEQQGEELRRSRDVLEQRVAERTARLVQAADTVRSERQRLLDVLETLPVIVVLLRPDYRVVWANRAYRDVFGDNVARLCYASQFGRETPCVDCQAFLPLQNGAAHDWEWKLPNGRTFETHNFPFADADGSPLILEMNVDITERRQAETALRELNETLERRVSERTADLQRSEEALRDADRRKDEFLGMLSHELRNPLAPIRNSLFILDHVEPTGPQARRAKEIAARQVTHLTHLVDDLLDVTRIARGKIALRRAELDLSALARRTADDHRPLMQDRELDLELVLPPTPVIVNGDDIRLAQVLGNLLHNASKFTPPGGRVTLAVEHGGGNAAVHVRDTGVGMDAETLKTIFEPFVQAKQSIARSEGGLGLGLALVKGLVTMHGGEIMAHSAGHGRGATFTITLPLHRRQLIQARPSTHAEGSGAARRRVLVVDDNRDAAESLAELLEMSGHEVAVAYDGPGAVASALANRPDVVLCDIGLPGMDGYEVARRVRAGGADDIKLVAVSGYAQPEDVARATEAGFDAHVAKPPDPERIAGLLA